MSVVQDAEHVRVPCYELLVSAIATSLPEKGADNHCLSSLYGIPYQCLIAFMKRQSLARNNPDAEK